MEQVAAEYMALVNALSTQSDDLSRLGAGVLAAISLEIASDSRTFSRLFGISHALVLREVTTLSVNSGYIDIKLRDIRTQRTHYELSEAGQFLVKAVLE